LPARLTSRLSLRRIRLSGSMKLRPLFPVEGSPTASLEMRAELHWRLGHAVDDVLLRGERFEGGGGGAELDDNGPRQGRVTDAGATQFLDGNLADELLKTLDRLGHLDGCRRGP